MYNILFWKEKYKVNIHILIRNILKLMNVYSACSVNLKKHKFIILIVIINNIEISESIFMWPSTI
jgi:hypothetical protein